MVLSGSEWSDGHGAGNADARSGRCAALARASEIGERNSSLLFWDKIGIFMRTFVCLTKSVITKIEQMFDFRNEIV